MNSSSAPKALSAVTIGESDAVYLFKRLDRLLDHKSEDTSITLDLKSRDDVVIRFHGCDAVLSESEQVDDAHGRRMTSEPHEPNSVPVELTLQATICDHASLAIAMDPRYLLNALRIGFRQIYLQSARSPIFCSGQQGNYTWMAASPSFVLEPESVVHRLSTVAKLAVA